MFDVKDIVSNDSDGGPLSPEQAAVGLSLRRYYQLHPLGPTPARLRMLLTELERRVEATR